MLQLPDDLYGAVLDDPEDLRPRRQCATWLEQRGDPYGKYIRLMLDWFGHGDPKRARKLYNEANQLERRHGDRWRQPVAGLADESYVVHTRGGPIDAAFARGFVERVRMPAARFLARADELFRRAPIRHLSLHGVPACAAELFASPHLARMRSLALGNDLSDEHVQLLLGSAHVSNLAMLRIGGHGVSERSVELIAASKNVPALRSLSLGVHTKKFREQQIESDWTDPMGGIWDTTDYARRLEDKFGYQGWLHERELHGQFLSFDEL